MEAGHVVDVAAVNAPAEGSLADFWLRFRTRPWARRSLLVFPRDSVPRRLAISITHWTYFSTLSTTVVLANSGFMLLYQPRESEDIGINRVLADADFVFNLVFLFEMLLQVVATGLVVPDPNEGHQTDIYSARDLASSRLGMRTIPPTTIGNIATKAPHMSVSRLRAILAPFYEDDADGGGAAALLRAIEDALTVPAPTRDVSDLIAALAERAWRFLPRHRRPQACPCRRFVTGLACLAFLRQLCSEALDRAASQPGGAVAAASDPGSHLYARLSERSEAIGSGSVLSIRAIADVIEDACEAFLIEHIAQLRRERADAMMSRSVSAAGSKLDVPVDEALTWRLAECLEEARSRGGDGAMPRGAESLATPEKVRKWMDELSAQLMALLWRTLDATVEKLQRTGVLSPRVRLKMAYLLVNENRLECVPLRQTLT